MKVSYTVPAESNEEPAATEDIQDNSIQTDTEAAWTKVQRRNGVKADNGILLIGDSIIKSIDPSRMPRRNMMKRIYDGWQLQEINEEAKLPAEGVETVIIHAATNNVSDPNQSPVSSAMQMEEPALSIQR